MKNELKTKNLGLAAYIKMRNYELLRMEEKYFVFKCSISEQSFLVDYLNTCCHEHDVILCELRRLLQKNINL